MLALNQILQNRYRIIRQLGHGGMGAVYEAIDERFGEPIALKEIIVQAINQDQKDSILKAFEREAKSLAKARHESIPYVRDYFSELDRQFLVMELVEGDDLAELMAKNQSPFPVTDVLKWLDQMLDTLDYLHSLNPPIIHRDIKPQNLKVNSRGKIKLLDFGVAKNLDSAATVSDHTFIGATLDYSPIEQILRVIDPTFREFILLKHKNEAEAVLRQNTDARCDIYSLGATFYHLLTNSPPVDSTKRAVEVWSGNPDPLENPSVLNPHLSPAISASLLKAMEIERDNRYVSIREMQAAMQKTIAGKDFFKSSTAPKPFPTGAKTIAFNSDFANNSQSSNPTIPFSPNNAQTLPKSDLEKSSPKKFLGVALLIGLVIFAAVGISGVMLFSRSNSNSGELPVSNTTVAVPSISPADSPFAEPEKSPAVPPNSAPSQTLKEDTESEKPTTKTSKPNATASKPEKTQTPASANKPEQAPTKPKPTFDPNCVFTNSCP